MMSNLKKFLSFGADFLNFPFSVKCITWMTKFNSTFFEIYVLVIYHAYNEELYKMFKRNVMQDT